MSVLLDLKSLKRKSKREKEHEPRVLNAIVRKEYIDKTYLMNQMPSINVREWLEQHFRIKDIRTQFRLFLVEDLGDFKVFIEVPNGKTEYDFNVWFCIFKNNDEIILKIPTHDLLGRWFIKLRQQSPCIEEYLINAILRLIRDRMPIGQVLKKYFTGLSSELYDEIHKFLSTLKWIAIQEDANYPPSQGNLGSRFSLAVYVLLEAGFELKDIRRVIKFR